MDILEDLQWRGAINQCTDLEGLRKLLKTKKVSLYCGTDPTGDSLHIGHLIPFIMLKRFQLAGHHPYILIGGGTGFIGDPSGRKTERSLQTTDQVEHNEKALTAQMIKLFGTENFDIVNNYDWLSKIDLLSFLRDYGKSFNVNTMLSKEAVASRLDNGISFTEFSYQILQSIDFYHLLKDKDILIKMAAGGAQPNISQQLIKEYQISLPPLKEQQKIAEILSSVDAAIEKTEQVIAKMEEVKKGLMQQLLTGQVRVKID